MLAWKLLYQNHPMLIARFCTTDGFLRKTLDKPCAWSYSKRQMPNEEASARNENKRTRLTVFCVNFTVPSKNLQIRLGRTEAEEMCRIVDTFSPPCVPPALQEPSMGMDWFRAFYRQKNKKPGGFYGNNIVHDFNRNKKRSERVLWNLSVLECGNSQNQVQRQCPAHDRSGSAWKQLWCGLWAASGAFELADLQQILSEMEKMGESGLKENSGSRTTRLPEFLKRKIE